jgi:SAM-dependent methyltransferase
VHHARRIVAEAGVENCEFVVADSSEPAAAELAEAFDVYYASYGVLVWVPDIDVWFRAAATHLRPSGELVLIDEHPYAATFEGGVPSEHPPVSAPYWQSQGPYTTTNRTSYSGDPDVITHDVQVKWPLQEYAFSHYRSVPEMTEGADGYHHHPRWSASVPFMFSLTLRREA